MTTPMACLASARAQRMEMSSAPCAPSSIPIAGRAFFPLLPLLLMSSIAFVGQAQAQAQAQTLPDAGSLQRETGRVLQAPQSVERPSAATASPAMAQDARSTRVTVKQIIVDGARLIPATELAASLNDLKGQSLTLAELEQAAQRIANLYRDRGWFARVYLPQQDVSDGTIHIQILEGHYGGSRLDNQSQRANAAYVQNVITHRLKTGEALPVDDLERGLLLANDLPGIRALGVLEAGQQAGQTQLQVKLEDTPFMTGDLALNNYGIKSTGRAQLTGGASLNNLSGRGDQLSLRGLMADRIWNAQLRYSLPLGQDGWRLASYYSSLEYKLGDAYAALDAKGTAQVAGLNLSYPLIRQSSHNLYFSGGYEHRRYDDDTLNTPLRRHAIEVFSLGMNGDIRDSLAGGGITWGSLTLTQGKLDLKNLASDLASDAAGPRTQGSYTKLAGQISRLQALGSSGWQLSGSLSGQTANRNLASSERMSLGGAYGVRAYPSNEGTGDEGVLLKLELQRNLGQGWQAIGFIDAGHIHQQKNRWPTSAQPNSYGLAGAGLGMNWNKDGWQVAFNVATPIGSNPGRNAQGRNNDGSKTNSSRFWLTLSKAF